MWEFATALASEFAKGGLLILFMTLMLALSVGLNVYKGIEERKDRKDRDTAEDIAKAATDAKFDALRDRYQEKFDTLLQKYNEAMAASTRQTEGYIEAGRNMKDLIVELKTTISAIKDQLLVMAARKGGGE